MEVMRKYILKVLTIFILLFGIFINSPNYSFSFDYENGHFETINSNLSIQGCPVKLKDGRILILDIDKNYIFDPKTNTASKVSHDYVENSLCENENVLDSIVVAQNDKKTQNVLKAYIVVKDSPYEKVVEDTERDNFMSAEEAKAYGLIDEIVVSRSDTKEDK